MRGDKTDNETFKGDVLLSMPPKNSMARMSCKECQQLYRLRPYHCHDQVAMETK